MSTLASSTTAKPSQLHLLPRTGLRIHDLNIALNKTMKPSIPSTIPMTLSSPPPSRPSTPPAVNTIVRDLMQRIRWPLLPS
ncbi:hypothetical protein D8674_013061 [Pyrus ussuriensis x Pyrus communis]|uniref:Uncharacterized protein n=1 Tax=Pyrus ussuriensis x Pyrus communis TaxID=2448454 RepID=A0A5N5GU38_9ROSA|nr:hypothetical protein D8674_013061 [Pyrus ussuriensis x Pyrus communis]